MIHYCLQETFSTSSSPCVNVHRWMKPEETGKRRIALHYRCSKLVSRSMNDLRRTKRLFKQFNKSIVVWSPQDVFTTLRHRNTGSVEYFFRYDHLLSLNDTINHSLSINVLSVQFATLKLPIKEKLNRIDSASRLNATLENSSIIHCPTEKHQHRIQTIQPTTRSPVPERWTRVNEPSTTACYTPPPNEIP